MDEEYHDEDLEALLVEALGSKFLEPKTQSAFAYGDSKLLSYLYEDLKGLLDGADISIVLDKLRDRMVEGKNLGTVKGIHNTTLNCRRCPNLAAPAVIPSWNVADPDVVFILENPSQPNDVFDLLASMLKEAGFTSRRCALTYLARCKKKPYHSYNPDNFSNCNDYLLSEIQLWNPKLVVLFGATCHSSFFGFGHGLGNVRGKVQWLGPWAFLSTYSPIYAQKAGSKQLSEMKADLLMAKAFVYGESNEGSVEKVLSVGGPESETKQ